MRGNHRTATTTIPDACTAFIATSCAGRPRASPWRRRRQLLSILERQLGNVNGPFGSPQFLILNIAVGDWGGQMGVNDAIFPVTMEVDYVRVYQ